jgi:RHS repeat-associated protein
MNSERETTESSRLESSGSETDAYYYRARYYDPSMGRFLSEDPEAFRAGPTNFYPYVGNEPVQWSDPLGLCKSCGLVEGPGYSVSGQVPGGTPFSWHAIFMNDETHDPACCEVRQFFTWVQGSPPVVPDGLKPELNTPYEDRDKNGKRYGRRTGSYAPPRNTACNQYFGIGYSGCDTPVQYVHTTVKFQLKVVDVCNGGRVVFMSKPITEKF